MMGTRKPLQTRVCPRCGGRLHRRTWRRSGSSKPPRSRIRYVCEDCGYWTRGGPKGTNGPGQYIRAR